MRHLLRFERRATTHNEFNEETGVWQELATAYGEFEELKGAELFSAMQSQSKVTARITCRYMPALAGLTPKDRIRSDQLIFDIQAIVDSKMRHRHLQFLVADHSTV